MMMNREHAQASDVFARDLRRSFIKQVCGHLSKETGYWRLLPGFGRQLDDILANFHGTVHLLIVLEELAIFAAWIATQPGGKGIARVLDAMIAKHGSGTKH